MIWMQQAGKGKSVSLKCVICCSFNACVTNRRFKLEWEQLKIPSLQLHFIFKTLDFTKSVLIAKS